VHWLNDSRHVVMGLRDHLWLGDTESGSLTRLTTTTSPLRLPMAGRENTIAFTEWLDDFDLVELPLSGGTPRPVVNSTRYDGSGVWSPRGGMLAYIANRARGDEIWLRSGDTLSDRRLLTPDDFAGSRPDRIRAPTFSPDGQWLAFTTFKLRPSLDAGVWVMPIRGGTPRRVSAKDLIANRGIWSADGRQMAVHGLRNGSMALWIANIGSPEMRHVMLADGLAIREMEWSPTGEFIAALEYRPEEPRPAVLIDPSNGAIRRVPALNASLLAWAHDGKRLYGLGAGASGTELREMEIASGTVRTIAVYDTHVNAIEDTGNVRRLTFSPDGRSLLTTVYTNRSNVWLLKGLQLPKRSWWPFAN
jgi:Tol biopolymer transport system component